MFLKLQKVTAILEIPVGMDLKIPGLCSNLVGLWNCIFIINQCDLMDNKFNWMEKEYQHFYSDDLNNDPLNFSRSQNQSQYQDYVDQLNCFPHCPEIKTQNLSTNYGTNQVLTNFFPQPIVEEEIICLSNEIEISPACKRLHQLIQNQTNSKVTNLNKFVKTKTIGHLRVLEKSKLLDKRQREALETYQIDGCSYASQEKLFNLASIQEKCTSFFNSSNLVRNMLNSEASFVRKVELLKSIKKVGKKTSRHRIKKHKRADGQKSFS